MNKHFLLIAYFVGSLLSPLLAYGEVYQWVDAQGRVYFGNVPPKQQSSYKLGEIKLKPTIPAASAKPSLPVPSKPETADPTPKSDPVIATVITPPEKHRVAKKQAPQKQAPQKQAPQKQAPQKQVAQKQTAQKQTAQKRVAQKQTAQKRVAQKQVIQKQVIQEQVIQEQVIQEQVVASISPQHAEPNREDPSESALQPGKEPSDKKVLLATKDADKCGVFTGFVNAYKLKVADECFGASCEVYKRSLKKYQKKQARYC